MVQTFTASDGKQFTDRNAWRKYEFETNYTFKNRKNEKLTKLPGKIQGQPFELADLNNCEVLLLDYCDSIQIDNLQNCKVFIGPCAESVFIRDCAHCKFTVACKQLRFRDCKTCEIGLYSLTDPIIETSNQIKFYPFNGAYEGLREHFQAAHLEPENNHWNQVYDFNDPAKTGVNWSLGDNLEEWKILLAAENPETTFPGVCENPVPRNAQAIANEGGCGESFSIHTTQAEATHHIDAKQALESMRTPPNQVIPPAPASQCIPPSAQSGNPIAGTLAQQEPCDLLKHVNANIKPSTHIVQHPVPGQCFASNASTNQTSTPSQPICGIPAQTASQPSGENQNCSNPNIYSKEQNTTTSPAQAPGCIENIISPAKQ